MSNSNYQSVNPISFPENTNWCLSAKIGTKRQVMVKLSSGKSYNYVSRYPVSEGDIVIIGNDLAFGDSECSTDVSPNTGLYGQVESIAEKMSLRKETAVELDFVFTTNVNKSALKQCAKYLEIDDYHTTLQFGSRTSPVRPINHFIRRFLSASSILANQKYADAAMIELAKKTITEIPVLQQDVLELWHGCWPPIIELEQIYIPDVDCESVLKGIAGEAFVRNNSFDGRDFPYQELLENDVVKQFIAKYSYLGAISIMERGGFYNMLKAFLEAKPPIENYTNEIVSQCQKNEVAAEIIKASIC